MEIRPDFYDAFACLAGGCRHSCCRGWDIELDEETAGLYRALPGALGDALRAAMQQTDGVWSFARTASDACPLLRGDGLCRVVAELGEDALCDTCALHPRFFEDVGAHELCGVSASCEAAAALLLGGDGELTFLTERGDALTLRELLPVLGLTAPEDALRYAPAAGETYCRALLRRYAACEPIDEAWTRELAALAGTEDLAARAEIYIKTADVARCQRMFDYILYRQLERAEASGMGPLLRFARESVDFILLWSACTGDLPERLRRWSAEIEYSTENVDILLGRFT